MEPQRCRQVQSDRHRAYYSVHLQWLTNRGVSFLGTLCSRRSLADSQALCPDRYVGTGALRQFACLWTRAEKCNNVAHTCLQTLQHWAWTEKTATSLSWWSNSGGWYPSAPLKGKNPTPATMRELCAYSAQGNQELQAGRGSDSLDMKSEWVNTGYQETNKGPVRTQNTYRQMAESTEVQYTKILASRRKNRLTDGAEVHRQTFRQQIPFRLQLM